MAEPSSPQLGEYYFALPRLIAVARGGSGARAETNRVEAYLGGVLAYAVWYLFLATIMMPRSFLAIPWLIILLFVTWLFWLLIVYLNSLTIHGVRAISGWRDLSLARAQNILVGCETALFALWLSRFSGLFRYAGLLTLGVLFLNALAAMLLALAKFSSADA